MPKVKLPQKPKIILSTKSNLGRPTIGIKERATQYKSHGIVEENGALLCSVCGERLVNTKTQLAQHVKTAKHVENAKKKESQATIPGLKNQNVFARDLCEAFVGSDIPLKKLNQPVLRRFLQSYIGRKLPDESTIRKSYLEVVYNETIENIRTEIGEDPIWVEIDETTDAEGRYIANVIVGALRAECASTAYLLHTAHLERTDSGTIARTMNESFQILWPHGIQYDRVLLFVSDAAAYMKKAGRDLLVFYPRMVHVTCLAHAVHRVADCIRSHFKLCDSLISNVKKIFLKAPSRIALLKRMFPDLKVPPAPIVTRWGTWIEACQYYAENWNSIRDVVNALNGEDAAAIAEAQELFQNPAVFDEVRYIYENYNYIPGFITKLEAEGQSMKDTLEVMSALIEKVMKTLKDAIKTKLQKVLQDNPGLKAMNALLMNDSSKIAMIPQFDGMSPADLARYKYAPLVSCEVERSFSRYKRILSTHRRRFLFPNLKYYVVIECNAYKIENGADKEDDLYSVYGA